MDEIADRQNARILIVDDQAGIHSDFRRILAPERDPHDAEVDLETKLFGPSLTPKRVVEIFELDHALQGEEALAKVKAAMERDQRFWVAFVDMRMPPGWNGLETILKIWEVDPDIEIVICSAYSDHSRGELQAHLGRTDRFLILNKPFDPSEVVQLAASLSEKWRLARQTARVMARLQNTIDDLKSTNGELERVGYIAAHHLQEPLRQISLVCGLLKRDYADQFPDEAKPLFDSAMDCASRARQLVSDLRVYSQARTLPVRAQRFELADVARAAIEEVAEAVEQHGGRIELGPLPEIESDPDLWRMVLRRIFENSLRFSGPKPPEIEVVEQTANQAGAGPGGDGWKIAIRDNGIGIPARFEESVFTLFHRLHNRSEYPGSGAGLAICRVVVSRLGGKIWLDSEVGSGTTVHIEVPSTPPQWVDRSTNKTPP